MTTDVEVDVVLPCLHEAEALPRVLAGVPDGRRALVVDEPRTGVPKATATWRGTWQVVRDLNRVLDGVAAREGIAR